ncbi:MerR family transcriptional regulator [Bombilactobacillus thymidiniphilus]|uniref:MerR family transcriptional regulator n=1 Tax=Bombilactobacillus thymidiniphilus TaxID=2923363 RepID=A0ABY4PEG3_9LACO|nr:MerR family transcriptional regulator [Bombilactobacillus thymidiniphilus]UQS84183.1 MerR family transcriptional regulator [Bombilactobacillus thymidiniphilus]
MNIQKASELTNTSIDTIRYYEKIGLIPPIKRVHGIRHFDDHDIDWIKFSRHMRQAGLSIKALSHYLTLFQAGDQTIPKRIALLKEELQKLEQQEQNIQTAAEKLKFKINNYRSHMVQAEKSLRSFDTSAQRIH